VPSIPAASSPAPSASPDWGTLEGAPPEIAEVELASDGSFSAEVGGLPGDLLYLELITVTADLFLVAVQGGFDGPAQVADPGPDRDADGSPDAIDCAPMTARWAASGVLEPLGQVTSRPQPSAGESPAFSGRGYAEPSSTLAGVERTFHPDPVFIARPPWTVWSRWSIVAPARRMPWPAL